MANRKYPIPQDTLEELYYDMELGGPEIAKHFGCSPHIIYERMREYDFSIRTVAEALALTKRNPIHAKKMHDGKKIFSPEEEEKICEKYKQYGVNCGTLGREYNCNRKIIGDILKRHGITVKSRKEIIGDKFIGENNPNYDNHCLVGENNPNWIKDRSMLKSPKIALIRGSPEYKFWRKSVFERDNYTCKLCGKRGQYLNAHHIKTVSNHPDLILDINNGITLCETCHDKTKRREEEFEERFTTAIKIIGGDAA